MPNEREIKMVRLYLNILDSSDYEKALSELKKLGNVIEHKSRVLKEFVFIEVLGADEMEAKKAVCLPGIEVIKADSVVLKMPRGAPGQ